MNKAHSVGLLAMAGFTGLFSACSVSPDGRLVLFQPSVVTNYRTAGGAYVGCDNLFTDGQGTSATNQIRVDFTTSGAIQSARVRLFGENINDQSQDNLYIAEFSRGNDTLKERGTNSYRAYLSVRPENGEILPADARVAPQAVVVNPAPAKVTIVSVSEANRAEGNGAFRAELRGSSDAGSPTIAPPSDPIAVYSVCTFVSQTDETL
jgi:hypothetical protein